MWLLAEADAMCALHFTIKTSLMVGLAEVASPVVAALYLLSAFFIAVVKTALFVPTTKIKTNKNTINTK